MKNPYPFLISNFASHKNFFKEYFRRLILFRNFQILTLTVCFNVKSSIFKIILSTSYFYAAISHLQTNRLPRSKLSRHEEILSDERIRAYRIISSSLPAMQTYKRRHNEPLVRQCRWQYPIGQLLYPLSHRKPNASRTTLKRVFPDALTLKASFNYRLSRILA